MELAIDFNRELGDGGAFLERQSPSTYSIGSESTRRQWREAGSLERCCDDITRLGARGPSSGLVGELRDDRNILRSDACIS